jgi:histidinol-phosphate aminotransferase
VRSFLDEVAETTAILADEAYHHYADSPDYESVVAQVATRPNLIVARTFSKIHGLAGLRLGYAIAQPPMIEKLAEHAAWDSANIVGLAAARASLADAAYVVEGRRRNAATKAHVVAELGKLGYEVVPSQTNFILIDTRKEVKATIEALGERGVQVGRLFPALPQHLRVTIGTPAQMKRFLETFAAVVRSA